MGESRQELLNWINNLLQLNITRVEQLGTGAALTQVFDSIYGDIPMHKLKFNVNTEYAYLNNFKVVQNVFTQRQIDRPLHVERLVKCKFQDNLEFLQWTKRYWDQFYPGGDYDAVARRKGQAPTAAAPAPRSASAAVKRGTTPTVGGARTRTPLGGGGVPSGANSAALHQEIAVLKESVIGLERERDFYFSKLRDIELLVQNLEAPDSQLDTDHFVTKIQSVLYSTEEGFEIPEGQVEEETF